MRAIVSRGWVLASVLSLGWLPFGCTGEDNTAGVKNDNVVVPEGFPKDQEEFREQMERQGQKPVGPGSETVKSRPDQPAGGETAK
jgi:hypothetical protein